MANEIRVWSTGLQLHSFFKLVLSKIPYKSELDRGIGAMPQVLIPLKSVAAGGRPALTGFHRRVTTQR
ncbi:hypothetical protein Osc7112_3536 [Oscillatoria nigro-viridis PCC 7112]|uniref:Uncharacterized protein n=1 Tax=Phormidium nigroviride PCC 7112 TaxID=179408 RepID=K9VIH5_9CYAN|nr:hypothetical protein Osc7112_3536 [Oscillatoria nigro-viridis PCC 7112]